MTAWGPNTAEKKYFCIYDNTLIFVFLSFFFFFFLVSWVYFPHFILAQH
ncbi:hypothetical protein DPX39_010039700 [Trypanosoma brucei equiperdum]|uniref:Uncharacterized protein n=1 Tax=Trypanosoma brucei equiperdum TaxID=630700 RepID=A0A3L6LCI2_9TRYP|nr:hypothetical protein DPX39_010039700 [Trypanosoma brucei equiperdum]